MFNVKLKTIVLGCLLIVFVSVGAFVEAASHNPIDNCPNLPINRISTTEDSDSHVRFVKIEAPTLEKFYNNTRKVYLCGGILLPEGYNARATGGYPLRIHMGGFNSPYDTVNTLMALPGFRNVWVNPNTPKMVMLHLDDSGPNGNPYQVNSANNGPYGDAIVHDVIPFVESHLTIKHDARVLDGHSTGGWAALALQIFYPSFFKGVWAFSPDSPDFRAFQLANIYTDKNMYRDDNGNLIPSEREGSNVSKTVKSEVGEEIDRAKECCGGDWTQSKKQWAVWNVVYGPRNGNQPSYLWNLSNGEINHQVAQSWQKNDLRLYLQENWKTIGPQLQGKIHITVGEDDNYYLNYGVHLLDEFLSQTDPPANAKILYGRGWDHNWEGLTESEREQEMARAVE